MEKEKIEMIVNAEFTKEYFVRGSWNYVNIQGTGTVDISGTVSEFKIDVLEIDKERSRDMVNYDIKEMMINQLRSTLNRSCKG